MLFMILVKASENSEKGLLPPEQLRLEMDDYNQQLEEAGVKIMAKGLHPSENAHRIFFDSSGQRSEIVGPFENPQDIIAGFFIIEVDSKEQALEWARKAPDPQGYGQGSIELRQIY